MSADDQAVSADDHGHEHDHRSGAFERFRRLWGGHSHDHSASIDQAATTSDGVRALKVSLLGLAATAILQLVVYALSGSVALLADTEHNFSDALTAVPLGFAFWLGRRQPTSRYTYGYGRAEDLAGIFIVAMIAASAVLAGWQSVQRLLHPQPVAYVGWVIAASIVGFAGNELVAVYRIRVGRRIGSAALVADGMHARTDGLTSLAVLVGAIGVALGFPFADPLAGLLITLAILFVLRSAARDIYQRLMDAVDPALVDDIAKLLRDTAGVDSVDSIRVRWTGHALRAEISIACQASLPLTAAHDVATAAHHRLLHDIPRLAEATIHVSPSGGAHDHHESLAHHFEVRSPRASA